MAPNYDVVARTVRSVAAVQRTPKQWAEIQLELLRLRDAVQTGSADRIAAADDILNDLLDDRRVDGFGENIDPGEQEDETPPEPGLRELINSLLSDLGFPEPPADPHR
jgi:hypothetical protein